MGNTTEFTRKTMPTRDRGDIEEEINEGINFSSNRSFTNNKTAFNINSNSDELVEKIIDPETREDVR